MAGSGAAGAEPGDGSTSHLRGRPGRAGGAKVGDGSHGCWVGSCPTHSSSTPSHPIPPPPPPSPAPALPPPRLGTDAGTLPHVCPRNVGLGVGRAPGARREPGPRGPTSRLPPRPQAAAGPPPGRLPAGPLPHRCLQVTNLYRDCEAGAGDCAAGGGAATKDAPGRAPPPGTCKVDFTSGRVPGRAAVPLPPRRRHRARRGRLPCPPVRGACGPARPLRSPCGAARAR